jgi:hypothetical protein
MQALCEQYHHGERDLHGKTSTADRIANQRKTNRYTSPASE